MSEIVSRWAVAPASNLTGIAQSCQVAGEPVDVSCGGKIFVYMVLEGRYSVPNPDGAQAIGEGDLCLVRLPSTPIDGHAVSPVALSSSAKMSYAAFSASTTVFNSIVATLPPMLRISAVEADADRQISAIVRLLREEFQGEVCGKELLSGHLFEALFLCIIRCWYGRFPTIPCTINAFGDPFLSRAVTRIHEAPEYAWTLKALADIAGLSRAAFARRFKAGVGEAPLAYVTRWRLNLAAQMLDQSMDVKYISGRVGYASEFAFSRAFSRHHKVPPSQYRTRK